MIHNKNKLIEKFNLFEMYVTLSIKYFANVQEFFESLNLSNSFENYIMSLKYL